MLNESTRRTNRMTGGAVLIAIGLLSLLSQAIKSEWLGALFLLAIGGILLFAGLYTRGIGWIIPGGIVSGIGVGTCLVLAFGTLAPEMRGALMLLSMAVGFGIITPFSAYLCRRTQWWALFPAGGLAIVGGALLIGGAALEALQLAGYLWPLALIAIGVSIILRRR